MNIISKTPEGYLVIAPESASDQCDENAIHIVRQVVDPFDADFPDAEAMRTLLNEQTKGAVSMPPETVARYRAGAEGMLVDISERLKDELDSWARFAAMVQFWRRVEAVQAEHKQNTTG